MLAETEGRRKRRQQRKRQVESITGSTHTSLCKPIEGLGSQACCRELGLGLGLQRVRHN